jgi:hypothetical protein
VEFATETRTAHDSPAHFHFSDKKAARMKESSRASSLLQSGIIFSAISFVTSLGHFAFQGVLGRHLSGQGSYGSANTAIGAFMPLLGLLPGVATFAVTHYIAHYHTLGDHGRLQGLLLGCRKFLFRFTIAGSILAVAVIKPLSDFFHYSQGLMLITLLTTLLGLWGALVGSLCQGLGWFKRLALIGFLAMVLRVAFGWFVTLKWPTAETAVLASTISLLASLALLFWRKELSLHGEPVSPWNREFVYYFIVSAACVVGNFCFFQGDLLVAQRYFDDTHRDAYTAAGVLARALPMTIAPLLVVLFTSRSGQRAGSIVTEQLKLLGLSSIGLVIGAVCLFLLRVYCLKALGRNTPEAAAMIGPFAVTMAFVGLLQSLAFWTLASRWAKVTLLYGALGIAYWLALLALGKTPADLLTVMPLATGASFAVLFLAWFWTMRRHRK